MAAWPELVRFIELEYDVTRREPDEIRVRVHYGGQDVDDDERTQIAVVAREDVDGQEWVQIATPFARADDVDVAAVLSEIGATTVVGGAVIMGDYLVLRHSLPLENLDINEFVEPLELVAGSAELLEEMFTGDDDY
jgi:S1-C subfamily serine protease